MLSINKIFIKNNNQQLNFSSFLAKYNIDIINIYKDEGELIVEGLYENKFDSVDNFIEKNYLNDLNKLEFSNLDENLVYAIKEIEKNGHVEFDNGVKYHSVLIAFNNETLEVVNFGEYNFDDSSIQFFETDLIQEISRINHLEIFYSK